MSRVQVIVIWAVHPQVDEICSSASTHGRFAPLITQYAVPCSASSANVASQCQPWCRNSTATRIQSGTSRRKYASRASSRGCEGGSWTSSTARLPPSSCQPSPIRCSHVSGAYSLRAWVSPRGGLDGQAKSVRQPVPPAPECWRCGPVVEAAVEFGGGKGGRVAAESAAGGKPGRVQLGVPVIVAPP